MNDFCPDPRRLSALLVNFQSGADAVACVESLKREWNRTRRMGLDLEIVCVDDPGAFEQGTALSQLRRMGVKVLENPAWNGFGPSLNAALEYTSGDLDDHVCILTPEVVFLPGSIDPVLDLLATEPLCGAVAPHATIDIEGTLLLPPSEDFQPERYLEACRARTAARRARQFANARHAVSADWWNASEPFAVDSLDWPIFLRRDVVHRLGLLFDKRFVTEFGRLDFLARIRELGLELIQQPKSRVLRRWRRQAALDLDSFDDPQAATCWLEDRALFLDRHFGRRACSSAERGDRVIEKTSQADLDPGIHEFLDLGVCQRAPSALIALDDDYVLELGFDATFRRAAGMLAEGDCWTVTEDAWAWLVQGRYWVRALSVSGELVGAWTFVKSSRARTEAWQPGELAAEFEATWPLNESIGPSEALFG